VTTRPNRCTRHKTKKPNRFSRQGFLSFIFYLRQVGRPDGTGSTSEGANYEKKIVGQRPTTTWVQFTRSPCLPHSPTSESPLRKGAQPFYRSGFFAVLSTLRVRRPATTDFLPTTTRGKKGVRQIKKPDHFYRSGFSPRCGSGDPQQQNEASTM
jgi:hypothetical protein